MKKEKFTQEINYIKNPRYKQSAEILIEKLPDYFFEVPASSTGKYHPKFASGPGGLVRHTKVAVKIAQELLNSMIGEPFKAEEKDLIILSLILHDGLKHGKTQEKYVRFDHPILAAEFVKENQKEAELTESEANFMYNVISSHMGPFNKSNYSEIILPIPKNKYQKFVHMCDLLASKKFLNIPFDENDNIKEE